MNKAQLNQIEKEFKKTNYVLKKNSKISAIERNVVSFAKGLSAEQLALLVIKLISGLSMPMYRKKISQLLSESINSNQFDDELNDFIELLLQEIESNLDTACSLKVKDLLAKS
jgi:hypothetical protein